ncbi:hypothetical protein QBS70_16665 [Cronobacter sakazakii]|nr:hypothetical protein [Cronobacter sakazakii]
MKAQLRASAALRRAAVVASGEMWDFFLSEQLIIFTVIFPDTFLKSVA